MPIDYSFVTKPKKKQPFDEGDDIFSSLMNRDDGEGGGDDVYVPPNYDLPPGNDTGPGGITGTPSTGTQPVPPGTTPGDDPTKNRKQPTAGPAPPAPPPAGGGGGAAPPSPYNLNDILMKLLGRAGNQGPNMDWRNSIWATLQGKIGEYSKPVDPNDPAIKNSTNAFRGQVDRSVNNFRETAAQRAYAEGVGSGSFDASLGNAESAGGRAVGGLESDLMRDELSQKRAGLSDILGKSMGFISATEAQDLNDRIASIDEALKSTELANNLSLGQGGLALQGRGQDLANQHFYDDLAQRRAESAAALDKLLQQLLLGGG